MSDSILTVTGLTKHFGGFTALDNLDLELRADHSVSVRPIMGERARDDR